MGRLKMNKVVLVALLFATILIARGNARYIPLGNAFLINWERTPSMAQFLPNIHTKISTSRRPGFQIKDADVGSTFNAEVPPLTAWLPPISESQKTLGEA